MLERIENINPKLFDPDVELKATRTGFGEGLVLAGQENKNVVALCADLAESTQMSFFRDKFPERFVEMGVAEQNLVTVASGMAAAGKIPFAARTRLSIRAGIGSRSALLYAITTDLS